ncbi:MAG: hypothetical protein PHV82_12110 [Victivallaceae bacterium]|nr:hypothetical protein [Victivallaceae bacterium]
MINGKSAFNPSEDIVIVSSNGLSLHEYNGGVCYYIKYTGELIAGIPMLEDFNTGSVCSYKHLAIEIFNLVVRESCSMSEHLKDFGISKGIGG